MRLLERKAQPPRSMARISGWRDALKQQNSHRGYDAGRRSYKISSLFYEYCGTSATTRRAPNNHREKRFNFGMQLLGAKHSHTRVWRAFHNNAMRPAVDSFLFYAHGAYCRPLTCHDSKTPLVVIPARYFLPTDHSLWSMFRRKSKKMLGCG